MNIFFKPYTFFFYRLVSLNLAWTGLSTEDLRVICRRFPKSLERLNISGCRNTLSDTRKYVLINVLVYVYSTVLSAFA